MIIQLLAVERLVLSNEWQKSQAQLIHIHGLFFNKGRYKSRTGSTRTTHLGSKEKRLFKPKLFNIRADSGIKLQHCWTSLFIIDNVIYYSNELTLWSNSSAFPTRTSILSPLSSTFSTVHVDKQRKLMHLSFKLKQQQQQTNCMIAN